MTRSELLLALLKCDTELFRIWEDKPVFWEVHEEKCRLFSELYKRDQAIIARWEANLAAARGPQNAPARAGGKTNGYTLF